MATIAVFCGSRHAVDEAFYAAATATAKALAQHGHTLLYGGSTSGLMGAIADAALAEGGNVIGVCTQALKAVEPTHPGLSETVWVDDIPARKAALTARADAYLALPGGFGTLDELFHAWTAVRLMSMGDDNDHAPAPIAFLNTNGFYQSLMQFLQDRVIKSGFAGQNSLDHCLIDDDPDRLARQLSDILNPIS